MDRYTDGKYPVKINVSCVEKMDIAAMNIVCNWVTDHTDKSDEPVKYSPFIVWKCKILQNWKWLISTTLYDGMYYEVTYNGNEDEFYLDAYKKFDNLCVKPV